MSRPVEIGTLFIGDVFQAADEQTREIDGTRVLVTKSDESCLHTRPDGSDPQRDGSDTLVFGARIMLLGVAS